MIRPNRGYAICDETDGSDGNGAAGGAAPSAGGQSGGDGDAAGAAGAGDGKGGGEGDDAPGGAEAEPKDMKSAIDAALGYKGGADGKGGKQEEKPGAGDKGAGKETETHHANGKPKKDDKGQDLDPEGKVVQKGAPKVKSAAELALKPEELKLLGAKTQARFGEMIGALKAHEATIAKIGNENKVLMAGRDAIIGLMQETQTTQDQLAGYLHFNSLLQSGNAEDLEAALQMVEQQRLGLYKALGREPEGGGLDLLKDFPDLAKQVEEDEITRAAALELAKARRERAAREHQASRQKSAKQADADRQAQQKKEAEDAEKAISTWTAELQKSDIDYAAKEDRLLAKLDEVLEKYPPKQWLPTLKLLYDGIEITKAAPPGGSQHKPLRPSGARPGAKAPANMLEAINQGLGYATQKG